MKVFTLILLLWNPLAKATRSDIVVAEFNSEATCEAAAKKASSTFGGWGVSPYYVCVEK